jgi:Cu/Ag efflux protein CusF
MKKTTKRMIALTGTLAGIFFAGAIAMADDMGSMNGMSGMGDMSSGTGNMSATVGHGKGVVKAIDHKNGTVTLKHGPIKAFGWSGMTMTFTLRHRSDMKTLKKGEHVDFDVVQDGQGAAIITKIQPGH